MDRIPPLLMELHRDIQKPLQSFSALRQLIQVPILQGLGERIEQTPNIPGLECIETKFTPFMDDRANVGLNFRS